MDGEQLVTPTRPDPRWGLPVFLVGFGSYYLVSLVIAALVPAGDTHSGPLLLLPLSANLLLGAAPVIGSLLRGRGLRADFGLLPTARGVGVGVVCGAVSVVVGVVLSLAVTHVLHPVPPQVPTGGLSAWTLSYGVFLVVGAPITEELLVRGALWGALEGYGVPRGIVLVFTALVFAFLHLDPPRLLSLFAQGLAIGAARLLTGGIGASIVAHAANNLLPALALLLVA
ncbi:CPBP family intramembrane glutamic endopeptidase [Kutzneria albida]|uniref:CAAX prenyl protease 2/Lysostaphin resistance protein A-like domain-containing protein n=1 Tax=Kutzneria albida DSM 43870 TaxID=1449976 RepID=W5WR90_9PSEU|nr:CPBP family intramembrane glutamic endopeptidase [Kutzneria albida]AHI00675.1 hypothetical protein KALB_7317 [Kutzneria albida DSM 43870]